MPQVWLIAGPNGSGKSTLASSLAFRAGRATPEEGPPVWINPDQTRLALKSEDPSLEEEALSLKAAEHTDAAFRECLASGQSVVRETVLSTERLLSDCVQAQASGYHFGLFFVFLNAPELNVHRVMQRVRLGGHDVPRDKIMSRWERSIALMPKAVALTDAALVWDNSQTASDAGPGSEPRLIFASTPQSVWITPHLNEYNRCTAPLPQSLQRLAEFAKG